MHQPVGWIRRSRNPPLMRVYSGGLRPGSSPGANPPYDSAATSGVEGVIDTAPFARPAPVGMRNANGVDDRLDFPSPVIKESGQSWEFRRGIEALPAEALQQARMVGHIVQDFCGQQAGAVQSGFEFRMILHDTFPFYRESLR